MDRLVLDISWKTLWRILAFIALVAILFLARDVILALLLAIVISSGLEVVVDFLERHGIPRVLGVVMVFLAAAAVIGVLVYFVIPTIITETGSIFTATNQATVIGRLLGPLRDTAAGVQFSSALSQAANEFFAQNSSPLEFFSHILGGALLAITVLVSSFYLSLTKNGVERFIKAVFPAAHEHKALYIYERSRRKIGFWFRTQIMLTLIMWLLVWGALFLLGVEHSFVIGVVAGILELMPFVGPIISGAIAVLIAVAASAKLGFYTLVVFLVLQQFEAHFLVPIATKRSVDLHPVIVIVSLLIGIEIGGVMGALVAVPVAAVVQEVLEARSATFDI